MFNIGDLVEIRIHNMPKKKWNRAYVISNVGNRGRVIVERDDGVIEKYPPHLLNLLEGDLTKPWKSKKD